jgi:uncharacterized protein YqcC (DUF446 family)
MSPDPGALDAMVLAWLALCWLGYPRLVALIENSQKLMAAVRG